MRTLLESKEVIIDISTQLFSQSGFHSVGVNSIVKEAKSSKAILYQNFASKEDLVESVLLKRSEDYKEIILEFMSKKRTPISKVKSIFDWHLDRYENHSYQGCIFIKAGEQYTSSSDEIISVIKEHKTWLSSTLKQILKEFDVPNPKRLSEYIVTVLDGLSVRVNMFNCEPKELVSSSWKRVEYLIINKL